MVNIKPKGAQMKFILFAVLAFFANSAIAQTVSDQLDTNLGATTRIKCGRNMICSKSGGKVTMELGPIVSYASSTTVTGAVCGKTLTNSAAATITLPEASTVLGCEIKLNVGNASNFGVNPADATDQIVLLTDAAGDSLIADAIGEYLCIKAVSANAWHPCGTPYGVWTDSN